MDKWQAAWAAFLKSVVDFLPHLLIAAVLLLVGLLAAKLLPRPVKAMLGRTRLDDVAVKYMVRVVKICIWALVLMMALDTLGVPVTSLLTLLAAVGAAVALAIKDNLSNLASGVVLLFTKPFKAGDFIEVEDASGVIREIDLMHTHLDTPGNVRIAIPNNKMMTATILNYSAHDIRRQDLLFSISYEDDVQRAMTLLQEMAAQHPMVLHEPEEPAVRVKEQAASAIILLLRVWSKGADYWELQFDLYKKGKLLFDEQGVTIPFAQLEVRTKE